MLDVCVIHPSAPSRLNLAPGAAIRYRENGKITAYDSVASEADSRFVPFAFESFGGLAPTAIGFLRDLETYAKESHSFTDYRSCLSSLAVLLQKGNAEMLSQGVLVVSRSSLQ